MGSGVCIASVRIQILTIVNYVSPDISSYMTNRLEAYDMECNMMLYIRSVRVYGELLLFIGRLVSKSTV